MGNPFLIQACLRLEGNEVPKSLIVGKEYKFSKKGHRIYQINVPMDLRTNDWKFLGRIVVTQSTIGKDKTEGKYIFIKDYTKEEKEIITKTYISDEEVEKILKENKKI